jgi:hypothetical protein
MVSSEHTPASIVPHAGKVFEDSDKSVSAKVRRVFDEDFRRLDFADDAGKLAPESALGSRESAAVSGTADILAGKTATDDVDVSSPGASVEAANVIPNGEAAKEAVSLPGQQD